MVKVEKNAGQKNIRVISSIEEMVSVRSKFKNSIKVGFVPTMGFLHEGHLSLIRKARQENDVVIVSIFVNPAQFGPKEDFSRYPRNLPHDFQLMEAAGVDIVFTPTAEEMYPQGFGTYVEPSGQLANEAEGASRPGHFRGVATVVMKLFQIIRPDQAYFGQKDAQQVAVILQMVADFNLNVKLQVLPIFREADGLAMSSRNAYLDPEDRRAATVLYKALLAGKKIAEDLKNPKTSDMTKAVSDIIRKEQRARLDYVQLRNPDSFEQLEKLRAPALLLVAAKVGPVRLIDNFLKRENDTWDTGIII